jgi:hypothetical protein
MNAYPSKSTPLPLGVKIAASYLLLHGLGRFIAIPIRLVRADALPPFSGRVLAYYAISIIVAVFLSLSGIALFQRRVSSRKMALGMLGYLVYLSVKKLAAVLIHAPQNYTALVFAGCLLASALALIVYLFSRTAREALS